MNQRQMIKSLEEQIRFHREKYYNEDPAISDAEFDALEDKLKEINPNNKVLTEIGSTPKFLQSKNEKNFSEFNDDYPSLLKQINDDFYSGGANKELINQYSHIWESINYIQPEHEVLNFVVPPRGKDWRKEKHKIPMSSLNKVNSKEEFIKWVADCEKLLKTKISDKLLLTEKLDGLSIELVFDDGELKEAITRGDGIIGELITSNVFNMNFVPKTIPFKDEIFVRGEIILRKSELKNFENFKKNIDNKFSGVKNLRNGAAGISRTKEPNLLAGCNFLSILVYDIQGIEFETEKEKISFLIENGFEVPYYFIGSLNEILQKHNEYSSSRENLNYDIDGLVIKINNSKIFQSLGDLNNRPRGSVAFKFGNEMRVSTIKNILWITGDTGRITPVAQIEPVMIAGAEIKQASLHNASNIKNLNVGIGDEVLVSRRNDVIPYVEKVVVKNGKVEQSPKDCQSCHDQVFCDGEYLVCHNIDCPAKRLGRLKIWIKQLDILEWGEKTLEKLFDIGFVSEPADLYKLTIEDLTEVEGFAELSARKLVSLLEEKKKIPMETFIACLGIEGVSKETGKLLVENGLNSFEKIANSSIKELSNIDGIGEIKAEKILSGINERLPEIERFKKVNVVALVQEKKEGVLVGLTFCFSGAQNRPRKELQEIVENNGGKFTTSITKTTNYLVLADPNSASTKAQKARTQGIKIISGEEFEDIVIDLGGQL